METLGAILAFLAKYSGLIEALVKAIEAGASEESIKELLKKAEIEASDAIMKEELGLPQ